MDKTEHIPECHEAPVKPRHDYSGRLIIMGAGLGGMISPEIVEIIQEIQDKEKNDNDIKPPKPPRRPNARIGQIALGH